MMGERMVVQEALFYEFSLERRRCHVNCRPAPRGAFGLVAGSGGEAGDGFPVRHGAQTMPMGGEGGATGPGRDEQIADGGEDGDEPLQASRGAKALHHALALSERHV